MPLRLRRQSLNSSFDGGESEALSNSAGGLAPGDQSAVTPSPDPKTASHPNRRIPGGRATSGNEESLDIAAAIRP